MHQHPLSSDCFDVLIKKTRGVLLETVQVENHNVLPRLMFCASALLEAVKLILGGIKAASDLLFIMIIEFCKESHYFTK